MYPGIWLALAVLWGANRRGCGGCGGGCGGCGGCGGSCGCDNNCCCRRF